MQDILHEEGGSHGLGHAREIHLSWGESQPQTRKSMINVSAVYADKPVVSTNITRYALFLAQRFPFTKTVEKICFLQNALYGQHDRNGWVG
jgi:hypothetical protein